MKQFGPTVRINQQMPNDLAKAITAFDNWQVYPLHYYISYNDIIELNGIPDKNMDAVAKNTAIDRIMFANGFQFVGGGSNRRVYMTNKERWIMVKVAINRNGRAASLKEQINQQFLKPFCYKVFDVSQNGAVQLVEKVSPFYDIHQLYEYKDSLADLLIKKVVRESLVCQDIGTIACRNYGFRDKDSPMVQMGGMSGVVMLDFPYVYLLDPKKTTCKAILNDGSTCCGNITYDDEFNYIHCQKCGRSYLPRELADRKSYEGNLLFKVDDMFEGKHHEEMPVDTCVNKNVMTATTVGKERKMSIKWQTADGQVFNNKGVVKASMIGGVSNSASIVDPKELPMKEEDPKAIPKSISDSLIADTMLKHYKSVATNLNKNVNDMIRKNSNIGFEVNDESGVTNTDVVQTTETEQAATSEKENDGHWHHSKPIQRPDKYDKRQYDDDRYGDRRQNKNTRLEAIESTVSEILNIVQILASSSLKFNNEIKQKIDELSMYMDKRFDTLGNSVYGISNSICGLSDMFSLEAAEAAPNETSLEKTVIDPPVIESQEEDEPVQEEEDTDIQTGSSIEESEDTAEDDEVVEDEPAQEEDEQVYDAARSKLGDDVDEEDLYIGADLFSLIVMCLNHDFVQINESYDLEYSIDKDSRAYDIIFSKLLDMPERSSMDFILNEVNEMLRHPSLSKFMKDLYKIADKDLKIWSNDEGNCICINKPEFDMLASMVSYNFDAFIDDKIDSLYTYDEMVKVLSGNDIDTAGLGTLQERDKYMYTCTITNPDKFFKNMSTIKKEVLARYQQEEQGE